MSRKPPSQRDPEYAGHRIDRALVQRVPGTGRLASASPAGTGSGSGVAGRAEIRGAGSSSASGVLFARDRFVLAAATPTLELTYLPSAGSEHVYLNGLEQDENTDWTRLGQELSVLTAMAAAVGDVLDVRYAYQSGLPSQPGTSVVQPSTIWKYATGLGSSSSIAAPAFNDSAWAVAAAPFWWGAYGSAGVGVYGGTEVPHPSGLDVWIRKTITTSGGDLTFAGLVDNDVSIYIDGVLVATADFDVDENYSVTVPVAAGSHVIAAHGTDDNNVGGILDVGVTEAA